MQPSNRVPVTKRARVVLPVEFPGTFAVVTVTLSIMLTAVIAALPVVTRLPLPSWLAMKNEQQFGMP
jgi:hypothetical protein